jgi:multiple sugar transport system ATP-binding protein
MNQGRIEQVGTPMEIYQRPATRFVAGFVGSPAMNFLPVTGIDDRDGRAAIRLPDGTSVTTTVPLSAIGDRELTFGVRAEHITAGAGSEARVEVIERLGERTLIYTNLRDGSMLVYDEPGDTGLAIGDVVHLTIDGAAAHLFGPTGQAIHG